jgi:hypothetical protein
MNSDVVFGLDLLLSIALGIGLSAACGFRVFVPFLVMSAAALTGHLELSEGWAWIGTYPALFALATATLLEVVAYYIPWLDNILDTVATPAAVVAGVVASAAVMTGMSPFLTWTLAAIAGGGAAGLVQTGTVLLRGLSTTTTLGAGNFAVATSELAGSAATSTLAIALPVLTLLMVLALVVWVVHKLRRPGRTTVPV